SVQRTPGSLQVRFVLTDFRHDVPVTYTGVLPDLFREGQGIIAHGRMAGGVFVADEVLAKHDEKYMPPKIPQGPDTASAQAPGTAQQTPGTAQAPGIAAPAPAAIPAAPQGGAAHAVAPQGGS
ncbi:MAG TPA: cytochrome c maturation protein CcmE, partial [Steroidobacteraceae bacterium]|nr:cytochrome c maturation protein CcmE [Steroidobacteraceae bacterium]